MKNVVKVLCLLGIFTLVAVNSYAGTMIPYKIKGELISLSPEVSEQDETPPETTGEEPDSTTDITETPTDDQSKAPIDLSEAVLTVTHEIIDDEGHTETITLLEQPFVGTFEYEGETSEPIEVTISLTISKNTEPLNIDSVIGTGRDVQFALIDDPDWGSEFRLIGIASHVLEPENKFTISGDLSFLDADLADTTVYLTWKEFEGDGDSQTKRTSLLMHNNSFVIEGDTQIPQVAELMVLGVNIPDVFVTFDVVLEPKGKYTVSQIGNQKEEFGVSSESGYHALLIDSWQQREDYVKLHEEIAQENERLEELIRTGAPDDADISSESDDDTNENENNTAGDVEMKEVADSTSIEPAQGCEDAVAADQQENAPQPTKVVLHQALRSKIEAMEKELDDQRVQTLKSIATSHGDPMARYLAVRLNPWERRDYSPRLTILRELESDMDAKFVANHIIPLIESMERSALKASNDSFLIAGQRVPEFSLVNYDGEDVKLFDLLEERDLVLIDFWASWCGPCIADFPDLKKLYSAYTDEGFEIVGVSIDDNMEDWKGGVDEHELPWVNLGELKDWDGPVAVSYGVNAIPKGFLVDSQGCIYKKNIRPAALKEFLVDRYGMDESLVEPEEETENTPDVSS